MPAIDARVNCPVPQSFRVQQLAGMFDVPLAEKLERRFQVELPAPDPSWQVGMIVGDSGSGKSTVAIHAYGRKVVKRLRWSSDQAIVDAFDPSLSTRQITRALISVGLGSPPAWCKPYRVLSTGEQFRADLARAMLSPGKLVAIDEFTSVVDRSAARFGSIALRKAIDRGDFTKKLIAVTCHHDVIPWLRPDWVLDMNQGKLSWRCLRQRQLELSLYRCRCDLWPLFAPHHYLDNNLNRAARCYVGMLEGEPAVFAATLNHFRKNALRVSRLVTLPTFQGVGLGGTMLDGLARHLTEEGAISITINGSHPAIVAHCNRSAQWEFRRLYKSGRISRSGLYRDNPHWKTSAGRAVATFRWHGNRRATTDSMDRHG